MPGPRITDEERSARVAALVRELGQYEQRAAAGKDEDQERWSDRAEQVRTQLRAIGHDAQAPKKRASTRLAASQHEAR